MPAPEQYKWKRVVAKCNTQASISRSEKVGNVAVDHAWLLIADFDALGAWHHEDSLDGLADFVFWGRDAKSSAEHHSVLHLADSRPLYRPIVPELTCPVSSLTKHLGKKLTEQPRSIWTFLH
jgi:hypothetical protein